jgi:hypothetical protein
MGRHVALRSFVPVLAARAVFPDNQYAVAQREALVRIVGYLSPRITGHAAALLWRQMMRVATKRTARFVPLNYVRDIGNENPHLLQIKECGCGLCRRSLPGAPCADRGARLYEVEFDRSGVILNKRRRLDLRSKPNLNNKTPANYFFVIPEEILCTRSRSMY